jgi:hypothetical protein
MAKSCFFQLTKVDAETGVFEGICASGARDAENERLYYGPEAKKLFTDWSETQHRNTGGRSWGNLRSQHNSNEIAGVLTRPLEFDDTHQQIKCTGKVFGENKDLLLAGAYGGMSVGGQYLRRWPAPDGSIYYLPRLAEISLVDTPSNKECTFLVIKADRTRVQRHFARPTLEKWKKRDLAHLLLAEVARQVTKTAVAHNTSRPAHRTADLLAYRTARERQRRADVIIEGPYANVNRSGRAPSASSYPGTYRPPESMGTGIARQGRTQPRENPNTRFVRERGLI